MQHDHGISVAVTIGPLALRVVLLSAVVAVAGFALLRPFLPEPDRTTRLWIAVLAPVGVLLELMLAGRFDLPSQAAVVLLAVLAVPVRYAVAGREPGLARRLMPGLVTLACAGALVEAGRAMAGGPVPLHTASVLALTGLAWLTLGLPRSLPVLVVVQVEAAALATVLVAGISVGMPW